MATLISNHFMLHSATAERLYFDYAKNCPIVDYHCHINPRDIADDTKYENLTKLWLSGDHYKWRLMRAAGIEEALITGDADDFEKFVAWASVIERAVGNPLYHWSNLELYRYFDIKEPLGLSNAEQVWETVNEKLNSGLFSARHFITSSNVNLLCTTDDPADDLFSHRRIAEDLTFGPLVIPTFRPDRIVNIEKKDFSEYVGILSKAAEMPIQSWDDLKTALHKRMDYFFDHGCRLADHAMERFVFCDTSEAEVDRIFQKKMNAPDQPITYAEETIYKSALLLYCVSEYFVRGWTMQLHFGCRRNNNSLAMEQIGPDTGFDTIAGDSGFVTPLANFMDILQLNNILPRMILYSLNPNDDVIIDTLIGCFQDGSEAMKIQHGAAWWFNDNEQGIKNHLRSLAAQGYLPGFIGMLTDSRSSLSYCRHEYFRRILCDYLGGLVEEGKFHKNMELLGSIVQDICYNNAQKIFLPSDESTF
ncbi:MAG: glucuronate isomerase [Clostridiales bacterium]|nr:glucuronate isomerase [Clostridiales bacterium]